MGIPSIATIHLLMGNQFYKDKFQCFYRAIETRLAPIKTSVSYPLFQTSPFYLRVMSRSGQVSNSAPFKESWT